MSKLKKLPRKILIPMRLRQLRKNLELIDDRQRNSWFQLIKMESYFKVSPGVKTNRGGSDEYLGQ